MHTPAVSPLALSLLTICGMAVATYASRAAGLISWMSTTSMPSSRSFCSSSFWKLRSGRSSLRPSSPHIA